MIIEHQSDLPRSVQRERLDGVNVTEARHPGQPERTTLEVALESVDEAVDGFFEIRSDDADPPFRLRVFALANR